MGLFTRGPKPLKVRVDAEGLLKLIGSVSKATMGNYSFDQALNGIWFQIEADEDSTYVVRLSRYQVKLLQERIPQWSIGHHFGVKA
jgi:hypothetical protein